jgi:hypothetical protein
MKALHYIHNVQHFSSDAKPYPNFEDSATACLTESKTNENHDSEKSSPLLTPDWIVKAIYPGILSSSLEWACGEVEKNSAFLADTNLLPAVRGTVGYASLYLETCGYELYVEGWRRYSITDSFSIIYLRLKVGRVSAIDRALWRCLS